VVQQFNFITHDMLNSKFARRSLRPGADSSPTGNDCPLPFGRIDGEAKDTGLPPRVRRSPLSVRRGR
jgi:hypothetical protein